MLILLIAVLSTGGIEAHETDWSPLQAIDWEGRWIGSGWWANKAGERVHARASLDFLPGADQNVNSGRRIRLRRGSREDELIGSSFPSLEKSWRPENVHEFFIPCPMNDWAMIRTGIPPKIEHQDLREIAHFRKQGRFASYAKLLQISARNLPPISWPVILLEGGLFMHEADLLQGQVRNNGASAVARTIALERLFKSSHSEAKMWSEVDRSVTDARGAFVLAMSPRSRRPTLQRAIAQDRYRIRILAVGDSAQSFVWQQELSPPQVAARSMQVHHPSSRIQVQWLDSEGQPRRFVLRCLRLDTDWDPVWLPDQSDHAPVVFLEKGELHLPPGRYELAVTDRIIPQLGFHLFDFESGVRRVLEINANTPSNLSLFFPPP